MQQGYEVEWVSGYSGDLTGSEFNPDACQYARKDFEYLHQARAFARKIRKTSPVFKLAWINQFVDTPMPDAPPLVDREYIGEKEEVS